MSELQAAEDFLYMLCPPLCDCCAHIWKDGKNRRVAADYWWATPAGNRIPLCEGCTAIWRANAEADPDLQAVYIRSIRKAP